MTREYAKQNSEEIEQGTQITDANLARDIADIEKPIRNLARDPKASDKIRGLKSELDQEAERLGSEVKLIKEKLLETPIEKIKLSTTQRTGKFIHAMIEANIFTVGDIVKLGYYELRSKCEHDDKVAGDVETWLLERGLKLKRPSRAK